jgi:hypothetical protein
VIHGILFGIITKKAQQQKKRRSLTEKAKAKAITTKKTPSEDRKLLPIPKKGMQQRKPNHKNKPVFQHLILQPIQKVRSKVRNDNTRASTKNTLCSLESHGLQIEHASLGSSANHGVLAADLVCGDGQVLADFFCVADDVEVLGGGLNHDDVGAFVDVTDDCSAGETAAAGWELVASEREKVSIRNIEIQDWVSYLLSPNEGELPAASRKGPYRQPLNLAE